MHVVSNLLSGFLLYGLINFDFICFLFLFKYIVVQYFYDFHKIKVKMTIFDVIHMHN